MSDIVVGLDIGTSKTCSVIAKVDSNDGIEILGVGKAPSMGLKKGEVVDIDRTINSLKDAVKQAEGTSQLEILRGYASVSGTSLRTITEEFDTAIADEMRGVTSVEINRLNEMAKKYSPQRGKRLLAAEPVVYSINGVKLGPDPLGETGRNLRLKATMFLAGVGHSEDVYQIVNGAQVEVMELLPSPLASAEAVLEEAEKNLGCLLIDIGGGTTDIIVFRDGAPIFATVLAVGGDHFDSDLAHGLNISLREAERIKINFGSVKPEDMTSDEMIEIVQSDGGNEYIPVKIIAEILCPRIEEIFEMAGEKLHEVGAFKGLKAGMVITGGTSLLNGCTDKATEILGYSAKVGYPMRVAGLSNDVRSPIFATGVGLVKLGFKKYLQMQGSSGGVVTGVVRRMTSSGWWKSLTR